MKDYLASIEKLRKDASEAALIRDLAADQTKREMFDRVYTHLSTLANELEKAARAQEAAQGAANNGSSLN
jgi:hypothetical protein